MQNIGNFGQTDVSSKPNCYQQNAHNQHCSNDYQQNRSDFVVANQFTPMNHGCSVNNKFIRQNSGQFKSYQNMPLFNENVDYGNQYQTQKFYEGQFNKQQIRQYQQDNYNHQDFNSNLVQNNTGLFSLLTIKTLLLN